MTGQTAPLMSSRKPQNAERGLCFCNRSPPENGGDVIASRSNANFPPGPAEERPHRRPAQPPAASRAAPLPQPPLRTQSGEGGGGLPVQVSRRLGDGDGAAVSDGKYLLPAVLEASVHILFVKLKSGRPTRWTRQCDLEGSGPTWFWREGE